jgi:hypothetical protein
MKKTLLVFALVSFIQSSGQKPAVVIGDKEGWHKIAETIVNYKTDTDSILVVGADRFTHIKFKIKEAPIKLVSMTIKFDNGEIQNATLGGEIRVEGESNVIALSGGERDLDKVTFVYSTLAAGNNKRARVELWGLKGPKTDSKK